MSKENKASTLQRRPATRLVKQAIDYWLEEQERQAVHEDSAAYAAAVAGPDGDLDPALESTAIEMLCRYS